jgi:hypothetical protein
LHSFLLATRGNSTDENFNLLKGKADLSGTSQKTVFTELIMKKAEVAVSSQGLVGKDSTTSVHPACCMEEL